MAQRRKKLLNTTVIAILTEAGYRCAVPTCRNILAIDLHHIVEVSERGGDDVANLIALCPTCHALFHRGVISREAIYSWKSILVSLSQAFDREAIDDLLFLDGLNPHELIISGDGVLKFSRLIAANLAEMHARKPIFYGLYLYEVTISSKGKMLIDAWKSGNRAAVAKALGETMALDIKAGTY
jgi:hypothetical protein